MDRNQVYLTNLLEKVPKWELSDPQQQEAFDKIRLSLSNASDLQNQLRTLYKVTNFSDFALALLWIVEKIERDPSKLESTLEEESFVLGLLKTAFGGSPAETTVVEDAFGFNAPQPEAPEPTEPVAATVESVPPEGSGIPAPESGASAGGDEQSFALTLEKLLEAVQGGSEDRTALLDDLTNQAEGIVASGDTDSEYKTFCGYLIEFLKYVSSNDLFDDIRVMNLLSNVFDPFSQWVKVDPGARTGLLEQPIETLRDFKALFE